MYTTGEVFVYNGHMSNVPNPSRVVLYRRVSTEEQATSGLGLAAQDKTLAAEAERRGWTVVQSFVDEGVSGSVAPKKRPALAQALELVASGDADVLMVAKLDRATRSVADLCSLLDGADRQGWDFVALDLGIDTSTPMGRAMAQMAGVFSELERKMIGQRTKDALAAKKAQGVELGRPDEKNDENRARVHALRKEGMTLRAIAEKMNEEGRRTARGAEFKLATVQRHLAH